MNPFTLKLTKVILSTFAFYFLCQPIMAQSIYLNSGDDLQAAIEQSSGGTIILNAGTYEKISIKDKKFTEENPLIVKAASGAAVTILGDLSNGRNTELVNCSYLVFDSIHFKRSHFEGVWLNTSDHIIFKNCEMSESGQAGIKVALRSKYVDFINCKIHATGKSAAQWGEGMYLGRGDGHNSDTWPDNTEFVWIEGCEIWDCGAGEAINVKGEVFNTTIRNNFIHDITLGTLSHGQKNEGAISLDHTADPFGYIYEEERWRNGWVENNIIEGVRAGYNERICAIYSAGTGNYIVDNDIRDVKVNSYNPDESANGIRLNNWSGDNMKCVVWNNTMTEVKDENQYNSLAIIEDPGENPNKAQSWYDGGSKPGENDAIAIASFRDVVNPGTTVPISLIYEATTSRDLVVRLELGQEPFTVFTETRVDVEKGGGNKIVNISIPDSVPIAYDTYRYNCFIVPDSGEFNVLLDSQTVQNVSCVEQGLEGFPKIESYSNQQAPNIAENLLDGDKSDDARWSAENYPQWVVIDYGEAKSISGTRLWTYQNRAYKFKVEASDNPTSNFTTIVDETDNTSGNQPIENSFATVNARYIKLTVTGSHAYTGSWISINEFDIIQGVISSTEDNRAPEANSNFMIYPNPANTTFNIQTKASNYTTSIFTLSGIHIYTKQNIMGNTMIDIEGLKQGVYLVRLTNAKMSKTKRIVIQ